MFILDDISKQISQASNQTIKVSLEYDKKKIASFEENSDYQSSIEESNKHQTKLSNGNKCKSSFDIEDVTIKNNAEEDKNLVKFSNIEVNIYKNNLENSASSFQSTPLLHKKIKFGGLQMQIKVYFLSFVIPLLSF